MVAFTRTPAVGWLLLLLAGGGAAVAHERFVAVHTGAVLSPRQYHMSPAQPMEKRQQGTCSAGSHACDEIGPAGAGVCCLNHEYCMINPQTTTLGACCRIGSRCSSPCEESSYQCNSTTTITTTTAGTTTTSLSLVPACCGRACNITQFHCPASLGGGCCDHGAACASGPAGSSCLAPRAPTPTVTLAPEGCTTGQISCAASLSGGCCARTQSCTLVGGQPHCADDPIVPTGSGVSVVDVGGGEGGLGTGGKAGVAVGVVVGCGVVIGGLVWWWLRRRKRARGEGEGGVGGGGGGGVGVGGPGSAWTEPSGVVGRVVGGTNRDMSDQNSDVMSRSGRMGSAAQDYFGPAPAVGPYSDAYSTSAVTTPGPERGGVPLQPHEPGDIAVPVEIDSRVSETPKPAALAITPRASAPHDSYYEDGYERYELYGSDVGQISPTMASPYAGGLPSPDERDERPR